MHYVHLGRSGLNVSRLCLSTMNFGPETTEAQQAASRHRLNDLFHSILHRAFRGEL